jgi:putative DNA primase/helicase
VSTIQFPRSGSSSSSSASSGPGSVSGDPPPPVPISPSVLTLDPSAPFHDRGRALLLQERLRGSFYWIEEKKEWYVWDAHQNRWRPGRLAMEALAARFLEDLAEDIRQGLTGALGSSQAAAAGLMEGPQGLGSRRVKLGMMDEVKSLDGVAVSAKRFDHNPFLLGVRNGIVDLRTGKLSKGWPEAMVTLHTEVPYYPDQWSVPGDWERLLKSSIPDAEARHFFQSYFGSAMTGTNHRESFLICVGLGGAGKSTIVNTIAEALGPYAVATNPDTFASHRPGSIREDLASFEGTRLVHNMELPRGASLDPITIKTLSGGDMLRARKLRENGKVIQPTWSCVVGCNSFPRLEETPDSGWWRRVLCFPFYHLPRRPDYRLKERLKAQLDQVLAWLIRGSRQYYHDQVSNPNFVYKLPKAVQQECARYRFETDSLGCWAETHLIRRQGAFADNYDLYQSYLDYCEEAGVPKSRIVNETWLGRYLSDQGYRGVKKNGSRFRIGVRLRDENDQIREQEEEEYIVSLTNFEHDLDNFDPLDGPQGGTEL